jgi:hypothetical protein
VNEGEDNVSTEETERAHPAPCAFLVTALAAVLATSCSEAPTSPPFTRTVHRTAAVVVHDSLGAPAEGATVRLVAEFDSAGIAPVVIATTDADGVAVVVLAQGGWGVHGLASGSDQKVAGATFIVPGFTRPEIDTIVVRLVLHTPSVAQGRALLGNRTEHGGTIVACPPAPPVAVTDSSGGFVLDLLPLGRWTITMHHPGFRLGLADIDLTTPGDTLTVADVHLVSDPAVNARQVRAAGRVVGHLDGIFRAEVRTKRSGGKP